jgi:hypothetical protein
MNVDSNAVRRPCRLSDWTFVLGLPASSRDFTRAKAYGEFCVGLTFEQYRRDLPDAFEQHIAPLTRFGLSVVRYATSRQYSRALCQTNPTILYTHCDGSKLEFRDGMIPFKQIVDMIQPSFAGIAEICACAPVGLQDLIKSRAPASLVKVSRSTLSSGLWMAYYGYFLAAFEPGPASFGQVCVETAALLRDLRQQVEASRTVARAAAKIG